MAPRLSVAQRRVLAMLTMPDELLHRLVHSVWDLRAIGYWRYASSGALLSSCTMAEHDPTRTDRLALYTRARAAEKAARDEAVAVVERWNAAIAAGRGALLSPTIRCAAIAGMPFACCPGIGPKSRY